MQAFYRIVPRLLAAGMVLALLSGCGGAAQSGERPDVQQQPESWGAEIPQEPVVESQVTEARTAESPMPEVTAPPEEPAPGIEQTESPPAESPEPPPEEPSPEPETTPALEEPEDPIEALLRRMTLEEKVAQLFVVTPNALVDSGINVAASGDMTRAAYDRYPVGGLIYMSENLEDWAQTSAMLSGMEEIALERTGLPAFLCVDEEGGTVARISGSGKYDVPVYPDMSDLGAQGDPEAAAQVGREMGEYLRALGFNVDFAPVADVLANPENTVVRYRSFGQDPALVAEMTAAFTQGLESQGVLGCYKHFPGHGATAADSHDGFAYAGTDAGELWERELVPFQDGISRGISMIMVGHIALPQVTGNDLPASLSGQLVNDLLRTEMGYEGLVITDGMNMGAISQNYTSGEAAVMALKAGVDLLLMPASFSGAYEGVLEALEQGELSEARIDESLRRIFAVKLRLLEE